MAAGACLCCATHVHAEPRFYGGARLAIYVSDVSASQEYDPRFGVGGGLNIAANVYQQFDLRVEANYAQKGANLAFSRSAIEWQMDYLEIPVLLVYNLMPKTQTCVELYAGASYGYPLQRQVEEGGNYGYDLEAYLDKPIVINPTTNLIVTGLEDSDLGFVLGVGLSVPVGAVNFVVDARYTRSLTDPVVAGDFHQTIGEDDEAVTTTSSADFSNRLFAFYLGFSFPLGSRTEAESE